MPYNPYALVRKAALMKCVTRFRMCFLVIALVSCGNCVGTKPQQWTYPSLEKGLLRACLMQVRNAGEYERVSAADVPDLVARLSVGFRPSSESRFQVKEVWFRKGSVFRVVWVTFLGKQGGYSRCEFRGVEFGGSGRFLSEDEHLVAWAYL